QLRETSTHGEGTGLHIGLNAHALQGLVGCVHQQEGAHQQDLEGEDEARVRAWPCGHLPAPEAPYAQQKTADEEDGAGQPGEQRQHLETANEETIEAAEETEDAVGAEDAV